MKVVTHISYAVDTIDSAAWNPRPPLVYCVQRENAHMKSVLLNITVVHELMRAQVVVLVWFSVVSWPLTRGIAEVFLMPTRSRQVLLSHAAYFQHNHGSMHKTWDAW